MTVEPVQIAVIGCGGYAFQLIKRIIAVPESGIVAAVTSRDFGSPGAQYCRDNGIPLFHSVEEMLAFGKFEVVVNPTPIHLHLPLTKQCLQAGFPVWLEKPPVATIQELDDLQEFADAAGHTIPVCFNSLYSSLTQRLKADLVAGRFGKVRQVKGVGAWIRNKAYFTRNNWAGRIRLDQDWILDGDVNNPFAHVLCNNLFFASRQAHKLAHPATVEAELYRCNDIETEDTSCVRIVTEDGVEVINWLTLAPREEIAPRSVIETEKALITMENFNHLKIEFYDGRVEEHSADREDRIEMIEHLCDAFRTGKPYLATLEMIRPFTVAVNCAFESAGIIQSIPQKYIGAENLGTTSRVYIEGVESLMVEAFESNSMYSEIGVPWSRGSLVFDAGNYQNFPTRFILPDNQD